MFIKGFTQGAQMSHSGPKKCTYGLRNGKNGGIPLFLLKWACHLTLYRATWKKDQWTIGLRKGLGKCEMVIFHKIPTFCSKIESSIENARIFLQFPQLFAFFGPARPGCAIPYKTNGISYDFRGFWCPWAHFPPKSTFYIKIIKARKCDLLADFPFFHKNQHFCGNQ